MEQWTGLEPAKYTSLEVRWDNHYPHHCLKCPRWCNLPLASLGLIQSVQTKAVAPRGVAPGQVMRTSKSPRKSLPATLWITSLYKNRSIVKDRCRDFHLIGLYYITISFTSAIANFSFSKKQNRMSFSWSGIRSFPSFQSPLFSVQEVDLDAVSAAVVQEPYPVAFRVFCQP